MTAQVFELSLTRQDQAANPYFYVPFDVPAGTTRIDVALNVDRSAACQIDLGLLEPQATSFPSFDGIRGWSGGARDDFFVATDDATPGYHYGPIPVGTWQVILGLYRVPEAGAKVTVRITLDAAPRTIRAQPARSAAVRSGAGWYKGDLHCHTFHSDAAGSPETLHAAARQAGLDFLAVADHNTTTQRRSFDPASSPELVFVRAVEITTDGGHANAFGVDGMIDFRITRPDDVHRLADHVHARGGLLSINHDKPTIPWTYEFPQADCMEVWQSTWLDWNWVSLERYQHRLAAGLRLSAIGGSDFHQPATLQREGPLVLARPTTVLYLAELSEPAVLAAMKSGNGYVTEGPGGPHLSISADGWPMGSRVRMATEVLAEVHGAAGDRLVWIDAHGECQSELIPSDDWRGKLSAPDQLSTFVRAEIVAVASRDRLLAEIAAAMVTASVPENLLREAAGQAIRRALSNPIYIGN